MKYDFDTMNVQELFELEMSEASVEALRPGIKQLMDLERIRREQDAVAAPATDDHLRWVEVDMGDGQEPQRLSTKFVEEYRKLLALHYIPATPEELFANSLEGMPLERLLRARPHRSHADAFYPEFRALLNKDAERVSLFLAAAGSFDQLVMFPTGRSSFTTYTHEFVDELRALQIRYRDLPKVEQP